jgi:hypothetical protein
MRLFLLLVTGVCAFGQIERPQLGIMLDPDGDARPVLGVAGSVTLGGPILNGVISLHCTSHACLAKTAIALISTSGETAAAPTGRALFAGRYIYFPDTQQLVQWHDGALDPIPFLSDDDVLALRASGDGLDSVVNRAGATWVEHSSLLDNSLQVINSFALANAAMLIEADTLLAYDDAVHLIAADGTDTLIGVAGVREFVTMGEGYVELVTAEDRWALNLKTGRWFLLPGVSE